MINRSDVIPAALFLFSLVAIGFAYGAWSSRSDSFPIPQLRNAWHGARRLMEEARIERPWYYEASTQSRVVISHAQKESPLGLTLIQGMGPANELSAKVVDAEGNVVHEWHLDIFEMWPDVRHVPENDRPKSKPGGIVHGIVFLSNGDLILNFNYLGIARVNVCSQIIWRLPVRSHHSLHLDDNGSLYASGEILHTEPVERFANVRPPFTEDTILEVSPEGRLIGVTSIFDLLTENGLGGLLYMTTTNNDTTSVQGDMLHLNDVESFPSTLAEGTFSHGDIMISLRNLNAVLVLDRTTHKLKRSWIGAVLRQHDPDFIDGNTISIFDNNNLMPNQAGHYSRIVLLSALDDSQKVVFSGSDRHPFFTEKMGKHQWLPNGNILITESWRGRALEVDATGRIVWEYFNLVEDGVVGMITEALRLPPEVDEQFFARASLACGEP